jgi:hypothetical protein
MGGFVAETIARMDSRAAAEAADTVNGEFVSVLLRRSDRFPMDSVLLVGNRILDGSAIRFGSEDTLLLEESLEEP